MVDNSEECSAKSEISQLKRNGTVRMNRQLFQAIVDNSLKLSGSNNDLSHSMNSIRKQPGQIEDEEKNMPTDRKPEPKSDKMHNIRAVQLYTYEDGKYSLDTSVLKAIFGPVHDKLIAIYCISGKFRSGKSFILSIFLKYFMFGRNQDWLDIPISNSFKYRNSSERVTKGIWITSHPVIKQMKNGQEVAVFLMDSQGWHDSKTSAAENAFVFRLISLMSSVMIFNTQGVIGEDDFHFLQTFSSTAKLLDEQNNDQPFQRLLILCRDWEYPEFEHGYYDDQTSIDGKNYKKHLMDSEDNYLSIEAKSIREIIKANYEEVAAYLMPNPGLKILASSFNSSVVEQKFVDHLKSLTHRLFDQDNIVPKKIGSQFITGKDLLSFANKWADEFMFKPGHSSKKAIAYVMPSIDETPYLMAYQTGLTYFDEKMKDKVLFFMNDIFNTDLGQIKSEMNDLLNQSLNIFHSNEKMSEQSLKEKYHDKLFEQLREREEKNNKTFEHLIELKIVEMEKRDKLKVLDALVASDDISQQVKRINMQELSRLNETLNDVRQIITQDQNEMRRWRITERRNWFFRLIGKIVCFFNKKPNSE